MRAIIIIINFEKKETFIKISFPLLSLIIRDLIRSDIFLHISPFYLLSYLRKYIHYNKMKAGRVPGVFVIPIKIPV